MRLREVVSRQVAQDGPYNQLELVGDEYVPACSLHDLHRALPGYSDFSPYEVYVVEASLSSINSNLIYYLYEQRYIFPLE